MLKYPYDANKYLPEVRILKDWNLLVSISARRTISVSPEIGPSSAHNYGSNMVVRHPRIIISPYVLLYFIL